MNVTQLSAREPKSCSLASFMDGASIEATSKDISKLSEFRSATRLKTVFIPWLPGEEFQPRLQAATSLRELGFEPVPHICARRIESPKMLEDQLSKYSGEAGVSRILLIGGDPREPMGPYSDSLGIIRDVDFVRHGIQKVGVAGHPEGHANMTDEEAVDVLLAKTNALANHAVSSEIVTQFSFDPDVVGNWVNHLRARGINAPIAIGVPGPAKVTTLVKFAARCGVGASASAVAKYGFSLSRLLGNAGPEKFIERFLEVTKGDALLGAHLYPFGGFAETIDWVEGQLK